MAGSPSTNPYRHPASSRLQAAASSDHSPRTLIVDHLLHQRTTVRLAQARRSLGLPTPSWPGEEVEPAQLERELIGLKYGRSRRKTTKGEHGALSSSPSPTAAGSEDGVDQEGQDTVEGIERVLTALLERLSLGEASRPPTPSASDDSRSSTDDDEDYDLELGSSREPAPDSTRLRLALASTLDVLLLAATEREEDFHPASSYHQAISFLSPISSASSPLFAPPSAALLPSHPLTATHRVTSDTRSSSPLSSSSSHAPPPPPPLPNPPSIVTIWDRIPPRSGMEGAWVFAGGNNARSHASTANMPHLPQSQGPRSKKALGRSKELYDLGVSPPPVRAAAVASSSTPVATPRPSLSLLHPSQCLDAHRGARSPFDPTSSVGRLLTLLHSFLLISRDVSDGLGRSAQAASANLGSTLR